MFSLNAAAATPTSGFRKSSIESRPNVGQNGPQVRTACHPSSVVYAAYYGWLGLAYLSDGQKEKAQASYNNGNFIDPENQFIKALGEQLKQ